MLFIILDFITITAIAALPAAFLIITLLCCANDEMDTWWNITKKMLWSIPIIILLCLAVFKAPQSKEVVAQYDILACQDTLGIKSTPYSRYYARINSEQYVILAVGSANNYVIWNLPVSLCQFYTVADEVSPHVEKVQTVLYKNTILEYHNTDNYKYNIYIPADTLVQDYSIDLK